jgi:hypothetical protein
VHKSQKNKAPFDPQLKVVLMNRMNQKTPNKRVGKGEDDLFCMKTSL